jgi:hypothetical protein
MYSVGIAVSPFYCPTCGTRVRMREAFLTDENGRRYCFCMLPKRKLIPLKQYLNGPEIASESNEGRV